MVIRAGSQPENAVAAERSAAATRKAGRPQRHVATLGSSMWQALQLFGQLTIIHPGFRSHCPFLTSTAQRRARSWHAFGSASASTSSGSTYLSQAAPGRRESAGWVSGRERA